MVDRDESARALPSAGESDGEEAAAERDNELSRLISLSDGVFAFAMTLLVVSVETPNLSDAEARIRLTREVWSLWPQILSFLIGFLVIGFLWNAHRRLFARVRDFDERLTKYNILLLMLIAFLPFPTQVLGLFGNLAFPSILYALVLCGISVLFILIIDHLDRNRLMMTRNGAGFDFARMKARHLVTMGIFLLSIPVALVVPVSGAGQLAWILLAANHPITERLLPYLPGPFHEHA